MKTLGQAMDKLLISLGLATTASNYRVIEEWKEIVGPGIAQVTEPLEVAYNRLIVKVKSPAWRYELNHQKGRILKRIQERVKGSRIKEIIFK